MKRTILLLNVVLFSAFTYAQSVKTEEKNISFESGNHNSIIVTIPNVTTEFAEKKIKDELKDWGGKYASSKSEFTVTQAKTKEIGEKYFDVHARLVDSKPGNVSIAFSIDLGGAYLTSSEHKEQYNAIADRLNNFAVDAAKDYINDQLKDQEKQAKEIQQSKVSLAKEKESYEEEINEHLRKIEELKAKIEKNKEDQTKAEELMKKQAELVQQTRNKLSSVE